MYGIVPGLSSSQDSMGMQNSATEPRSLVGSKSRSFTKHKGRKVVDNSSKGHSFTTPTPIITSVVGISSNSYTNSSHNNNNNNNNTHTNTHNNNVMTSKTTSSIPKYMTKKEIEKPKVDAAHASIEEIDQLLEDDALALLNIKKEMMQVQKDELEKLRRTLTSVKKEYDNLRNSNSIIEKEISSLHDKYSSLVNVEQATTENEHILLDTSHVMNQQIDQVQEELAAEQSTIKMQQLLVKRLEIEISQCRVDTAKAEIALEHAKHDLGVAEGTLGVNRQELQEIETQYEKMFSTVKVRKEQREGKINMLHGMSVDGEESVQRLNSSLMESSKRARSKGKKMFSASRTARSPTKQFGGELDDDEEDQEGDSDVTVLSRRVTPDQIREMISRHTTQSIRLERLQQTDTELKSSILEQHRKKAELSDQLSMTLFKIQQLASSRQIYQEVDLKDAALAAAAKECEEFKDKDFRLRLNIESMKQAIPRFLTKVTKVVHPKPNENQLHDAILKLEDELTKLIKVISASLMKDATPDDLALMSQQAAAASVASSPTLGSNGAPTAASDGMSEFGRLQCMPGYNRLQRQLFFNLMTARPDVSQHNIRIEHDIHKPRKPYSATAVISTVDVPSPRAKFTGYIRKESSKELGAKEFDLSLIGQVEEEDSMDRATVKNISKLIYERDRDQFKPANV